MTSSLKTRTKPNRVFYTWDKWECYPAGFFETHFDKLTDDQCKEKYREFLADIPRFCRAMDRVLAEWKNSCEHNLTNEKMNRIAWLGQAAACIDMGMPSKYRSGYFLLTDKQKWAADLSALKYLNIWLYTNGFACSTLEDSGVFCHANIY